MFCRVGTMPSTAVMCCCSRVRGAGVDGVGVGAEDVKGPAVVAAVIAGGEGLFITAWVCCD